MTTDSLLAEPAQLPGGGAAVPLVVLAYRHAGMEHLKVLLSGHPDLACTMGAGLLPLCEQAAASWREVEGGGSDALSALAATSIRAMATSMAVTLQTRTGKRRWCEFSVAAPSAAGTFLRLYPRARIACLHRSCPGFIRAALDASGWGLSGPEFAPFVATHPASTVAALAAYWAARTQAFIEFEAEHSQAVRRIRCEDLAAAPRTAINRLQDLLGLRPGQPAYPLHSDWPQAEGTGQVPDEAEIPGPAANLPADLLPPPLLGQVNDLHAELHYPAIHRLSHSAQRSYAPSGRSGPFGQFG
jgi:hypothetical protein